MVLGFILIMMIMGIGIATSITAMYLPFSRDLADVKFYNIAYYGAIAGIERSFSTLRYHKPGFEVTNYQTGTNTATLGSDTITDDFGFLTKGSNGFGFSITSLTDAIPASGESNILPVFSQKSKNFNTLQYNKPITIPLMVDTTTINDSEHAYSTKDQSIELFTGNEIQLTMRLNPILFSGFENEGGGLLANNIDNDYDSIKNDSIANWKIAGKFTNKDFTIFPTEQVTYYGSSAVVGLEESMIRENTINAVYPATPSETNPNIVFGDSFQPLTMGGKLPLSELNVISSQKTTLSAFTFKDIFSDPNIDNLSLSLSLIQNLYTQGGFLYPFLEYQITPSNNNTTTTIPDIMYHIASKGKVANYEIEIHTQKPTTQDNIAGDFTIVF